MSLSQPPVRTKVFVFVIRQAQHKHDNLTQLQTSCLSNLYYSEMSKDPFFSCIASRQSLATRVCLGSLGPTRTNPCWASPSLSVWTNMVSLTTSFGWPYGQIRGYPIARKDHTASHCLLVKATSGASGSSQLVHNIDLLAPVRCSICCLVI